VPRRGVCGLETGLDTGLEIERLLFSGCSRPRISAR